MFRVWGECVAIAITTTYYYRIYYYNNNARPQSPKPTHLEPEVLESGKSRVTLRLKSRPATNYNRRYNIDSQQSPLQFLVG